MRISQSAQEEGEGEAEESERERGGGREKKESERERERERTLEVGTLLQVTEREREHWRSKFCYRLLTQHDVGRVTTEDVLISPLPHAKRVCRWKVSMSLGEERS